MSCKQFSTNRVGLCVKRRLDVVYILHLKVAVTFPQWNFEKVASLCYVSRCLLIAGWCSLMSSMYVLGSELNIICTTQITYWNKYTTHCMLTIGGLFSLMLRVFDSLNHFSQEPIKEIYTVPSAGHLFIYYFP